MHLCGIAVRNHDISSQAHGGSDHVLSIWSIFSTPRKPIVDRFVSEGATIQVERCEPKKPGRYPTIVLLHGLNGPCGKRNPLRMAANGLARRGYVVVIVHYFDRTSTKREDLPTLLTEFREYAANGGASRHCPELREKYFAWLRTVLDAIDYASKLPKADKDRLGLMGCSLGGFLALSAALHSKAKIRSVVELCGGLPPEMHKDVGGLPPTLVIHGEEDRVVLVEQARILQRSAESEQLPLTIKVLPKSDHGVVTYRGKCNWLNLRKVAYWSETFLDANLKGNKPAQTSASTLRRRWRTITASVADRITFICKGCFAWRWQASATSSRTYEM